MHIYLIISVDRNLGRFSIWFRLGDTANRFLGVIVCVPCRLDGEGGLGDEAIRLGDESKRYLRVTCSRRSDIELGDAAIRLLGVGETAIRFTE